MENNKSKKLAVLLHGYGADENDMQSLIPVLAMGNDNIDFIAIPAPTPCEKGYGKQWFSFCEQGYGKQWFSVSDFQLLKAESKNLIISKNVVLEIDKAMEYLDGIISRELAKRGLDKSSLIIMGFSQGAFMTMNYTFNCDVVNRPYKAVSFSGFLYNELFDSIKVKNNQTPLLLCYGKDDDIVLNKTHFAMLEILKKQDVVFEEIISKNTKHEISAEAILRARDFIK